MALDKDALICDLAETYHILDYRALPVPLLATLCSGLRDDSRIKMRLAGINEISNEVILINIADTIKLIRHQLFGIKEQPVLLSEIATQKRKERAADPARDAVLNQIIQEAHDRMEGQ